MEIFPSIDLRGGRVVRLAQGDFARETVFSDDPTAVARGFARAGATCIHVVDLDGARTGRQEHRRVVEALLDAVGPIDLQLGGGVRSVEAASGWLTAGVRRVVIGTAAVEHPEVLEEAAHRFPGRVILGLDARGGNVAVRGWERDGPPVLAVLRRFDGLPLGGILHTDVDRDGLLGGPAVGATAELARSTRHPVFASGGVGTLDDLRALAEVRVIDAVVVGRALYSGAFELSQALALMREVNASC